MRTISKATILSVSFLIIMASSAMSPIIADIGEAFPDVDELLIKMVMTLPALFIVPMTLSTGLLTRHVHKKTLLIIGLSLYVVGGTGGGFMNSIYALLAFRAVLGLGIGILLPLATSLIADFFDGPERSKMMGYSTAIKNLGSIVSTVVAGVLVLYSWRYPFAIYTFGLVTLVLVLLFLPDQDLPEGPKPRAQISRNVWILGISHFIVIQTFYAIPAHLSVYVKTIGIGTGLTTGLLISLVTLGSFVVATRYHQIKNALRGKLVFFGLAVLSAGMFLTGFSTTTWGVGVAMTLVGFGLGVLAPNIYLQASIDSKPLDVALALAVVSSFSYFGQFVSPLILAGLGNLFGYDAPGAPFVLGGSIGVVAIGIVLLNVRFKWYRPWPEILADKSL